MSEKLKSALTNVDPLSKDEFIVRGPNGGYKYPFLTEETDRSDWDEIEWNGGFPQSFKDDDGMYRKTGFDMQAVVDDLPGPILEVGGPSSGGYEFLDDIELPSRPLIMNIEGSGWQYAPGAESLTPIDTATLDLLADARALPIADSSLGMVLNSYMTRMDQTKARTPSGDEGQDRKRNVEEMERLYDEAFEALGAGHPEYLESQSSPRIATIAQARRTLKEGGLFVMRGLSPEDAHIATALGLKLVMHTPMYLHETTYGNTVASIREAVFQKPVARDRRLGRIATR